MANDNDIIDWSKINEYDDEWWQNHSAKWEDILANCPADQKNYVKQKIASISSANQLDALDLINADVADLQDILSDMTPEEFWSKSQDLAAKIEIPIIDEDGNVIGIKDKDNSFYQGKAKQEYLDSLYHSALSKVIVNNIDNEYFRNLSPQEKANYIKLQLAAQVDVDVFTLNFATMANENIKQDLEKLISVPQNAQYEDVFKAMSELNENPQKNEQLVKKLKDITSNKLKEQSSIVISPYNLLDLQSERQVELGLISKNLFEAVKSDKRYQKIALFFRKREQILANQGEKSYAQRHGKLYNIAVGIREFAKNDTGKAIEMIGQLGITGGNIGLAATRYIDPALGTGAVGSAAATTLAGAMVFHTFAKGAIYPVVTEWKKMSNDEDFQRKNWFQKYKAARKVAKQKNPDLDAHIAISMAAGVAWVAGTHFMTPLGGKIAASTTIAFGNAIMKQREYNRTKKLYKLTGDEKYRKILEGDKEQEAKGLFGHLQKMMGSQKNQKRMAWIGATAGVFGLGTQIMQHVQNVSDSVQSLDDVHSTVTPTPAITINPTDSTVTKTILPIEHNWNDNDTIAGVNPQPQQPEITNQEIVKEAPQAEVVVPKAGDILEQQDLGNGISRNLIKGKGSFNYMQIKGIPQGEASTSEQFQTFLEKRINNMNQFNKLVEVYDAEGNLVPLKDATAVMLERINDGTIQVPEGMSSEHALYIAYMKAHYYGDKSLLNAIACPEGVDKQFFADKLAQDAKLFNTHSIKGVPLGYPTDGGKYITKAGTVNTVICNNEIELADSKPRVAPKPDAMPKVAPQDNSSSRVAPLSVLPQIKIIDRAPVNYTNLPKMEAVYPTFVAEKEDYTIVDYFKDRKGNGLTAKEVMDKKGFVEYRLLERDKAGIELVTDTQRGSEEQSYFTINDYHASPDEIEIAAKKAGGAVNEIIPVETEQGNVNYSYYHDNGAVINYDPQNQSFTVSSVNGKGLSAAEQHQAMSHATKALNEYPAAKVNIKDFDNPNIKNNNHTEIKIKGKKNTSYSIYVSNPVRNGGR